MKIGKIVANLVLALAGLLAVAFLASSLGLIPRFKALVVLSGSMEPAIKTGSLAVTVPSQKYEGGDIISFYQDNNKKNIVTHRIVFKLYPDGFDRPAVYLTSGDANKTLDQGRIGEDQIIGKLFFSLPYLGYFANFVQKPGGFILLVIIPATIIVYEELKKLKNETLQSLFGYRRKKLFADLSLRETEQQKAGINRLAVFIPVVAAALALTSFSLSFFSDKEETRTNSFIAGVWTTPSPTPIPSTPTPTPLAITNHLVINEVGNLKDDDADWVEIYNPTYLTTSLTNLKIGDEEKIPPTAKNEAMFRFPDGTSIGPQQFIIVASQADEFFKKYGFDPNFETTDTKTSVPDMIKYETWATKSKFEWAKEGDEVLLLNTDDTPIDVAVWGNGSYPGIVNEPGKLDDNDSIERSPKGIDTDNCANDFIDHISPGDPPTPGS